MNTHRDETLRAIARRNVHTSPLLRLPGELRSHIWEFIFCPVEHDMTYPSHELHWLPEVIEDYVERTPRTDTPALPVYLGLLGTCHTIYSETRTFPFALSTFKLHSLFAFVRFHASLSYVQRQTVKKVQLVFWDGVPDVYNVDEGVGFDDRFKKNYRYRSRRRDLAFDYVRCVEANAQKEAAEEAGKKKDGAVSEKMEKQIEKARRTAQRKKAKKGGSNTGGEMARPPLKKGSRTILHFLPNLESVEIAYIYRNPSHFDMPDIPESRARIYHDTNLAWKKQNRALLERFLTDDEVKVTHLPGVWEREELNGHSWSDLEARMGS
ncbi:hypothetical protein HBH82_093290 [Parastagonospora nodorum]|nr:hypothetical protein HBH82_093290 [Parastagonospora nodorum]KAH4710627.1 hypothetical protein HBH67_029980 [Parastagonospora nodorum]KAH4714787.1 hypothetical protein HBH78_038240 [Parastagonospora nodorum]KAH4784427.1 hypothetical protein HBH62_095220 [Parastagonospora nodorum]KAH4838697.1 hypothetical protein HBH63_013330 [Parastagonospora nodorum]